MRSARLTLGCVEYVNVHTISTLFGDAIKSRVIKETLMMDPEASHSRTLELYMSYIKGATGNLLGALEALVRGAEGSVHNPIHGPEYYTSHSTPRRVERYNVSSHAIKYKQ